MPWRGQRLVSQRYWCDAEAEWGEAGGDTLVNVQPVALAGPVEQLTISSEAEVEVDRSKPASSGDALTISALASAARQNSALAGWLQPSSLTPFDDDITEWAAPALRDDDDALQAAFTLAGQLHAEMLYLPGSTSVGTLPGEAFVARAGVCQDYAQIMLAALRAHGLPAAYVSGYIRSTGALMGGDASHAWIALWAGKALGWVGIDPTNACWANGDHVFTAIGRDYKDVAPIEGVFTGPAGGTMAVSVSVNELS